MLCSVPWSGKLSVVPRFSMCLNIKGVLPVQSEQLCSLFLSSCFGLSLLLKLSSVAFPRKSWAFLLRNWQLAAKVWAEKCVGEGEEAGVEREKAHLSSFLGTLWSSIFLSAAFDRSQDSVNGWKGEKKIARPRQFEIVSGVSRSEIAFKGQV